MPNKAPNEPKFLASENPNPVMRTDASGLLIYANRAAELLLRAWGCSVGDVVPSDILAAINLALSLNVIRTIDVTTGPSTYSLDVVPFSEEAYLNIYGFDISPRRQYQQQIETLRNHDDLTGLPNRQQLINYLEHDIKCNAEEKHLHALFIINIKQFRKINEEFGHLLADALLSSVASRLVACIPRQDFISRIANDEFAVVAQGLTDENDIANIAQVIIDNLEQPFVNEDHDITLNINLGIVKIPQDAKSASEAMSFASLALSEAKNKSALGSHFHVFHTQMHSISTSQSNLVRDLRYALEREQLVLHYQPQIDLKTQQIIGAEALIRWEHPTLGMISPLRFVSLAETHGLIVPIGEWVITSACQQIKKWQQKYNAKIRVAVNVSPVQFNHENLFPHMKSVINELDLDPKQLELEITEDILVSDVESAKNIFTKFRDFGVNIAIDDFGTGYSSLSYLHHLTVDILKIDRSFIANITEENPTVSIVDSIIQLGHKLSLTIVAEGIENHTQLEYISKHHCDIGQGYYFSKPLAAEEFAHYLERVREAGAAWQ